MQNLRKIRFLCSIVLTILLATSNFLIVYAETELDLDLDCKAAILIDAKSGEVIYENNSHERLAPASITKIMVLLLAMEALETGKIELEDDVVVSENAAGMGGSQVYLESGEIIKVEELLRAIAVRSGNDAAVALGEYLAGTEELFINMMNSRAKELGMKNTNFVNATGLHDENHYTSAYDISLMSKELLKHSQVHQWLTIWMTTIMVGKNNDVEQKLNNTNKLIKFYKGANGIKTGYTSKAGFCLSASATRGNLTLISVVLGSESGEIRFRESRKLLDYGFATYDSIPICKKGDLVREIKVSKGNKDTIEIITESNIDILIKKGTPKKVEEEIILPEYINAPISSNDKVGQLIYKIEENEVARVNLVVSEDVEKANLGHMFIEMFEKLLSN